MNLPSAGLKIQHMTAPLKSIGKYFGSRIISKWMVLGFDIMVTVFSYTLAYILIFNFNVEGISFSRFILDLSIVTMMFTASYLISGSYEGIIRHTGAADVLRIIRACTIATLGIAAASCLAGLEGIHILPVSISLVQGIFCVSLLTASRYSIRMLYYQSLKNNFPHRFVIIYGAGETGLDVLNILRKDPRINYQITGFLDDDPTRVGKTMEGVRIYAPSRLPKLAERYPLTELIIGVQNLSWKKRKKIIQEGLKCGITVKQIRPLEDRINKKTTRAAIRSVKIEDLLGREPIHIQSALIQDELEGKTILITGAAGSIGSELVRQILRFHPGRLILLDQAETGLYDLQMELWNRLEGKEKERIEFVICDITNNRRLTRIFHEFQPHIVFHTAGYKHVPVMEMHPVEAVHTNVFGTKNLVDLSIDYDVEKFLLISTDKAVNPGNVMGASKRAAEIYVQQKTLTHSGSTVFLTTRFGNVLGSNGSVVTYFKKQIDAGGPIRITDPEVSRYFMTIPEACQLVLEAITMGHGGEIFLFDMGEPVRIYDLARKMVLLSGLTPEKDIDFLFTGLRPGEKLHEELLHKMENSLPTHHEKIMIASVAEYDPQWVDFCIRKLWNALLESNANGLVSALKDMIPEYMSCNSMYEVLDRPEFRFRMAL